MFVNTQPHEFTSAVRFIAEYHYSAEAHVSLSNRY